MSNRNRLANVDNKFQRPLDFKRVLCVCSAGLLRSPTLAWVLSNPPFNFNTRAAGSSKDFALIAVDEVLIAWADAIVFVNQDNADEVGQLFNIPLNKEIHVLNIPDNFDFRNNALVSIITKQVKEVFKNKA